jgi:copper(I)-binding protein
MVLASSEDVTLVDARCTLAARVALVSARQRQSPPFALALPAQANVALAPGGTRIALLALAQPLKLGQRVPLTLVLRHADGSVQDIDVDAEVRRRSPRADHEAKHRH